MKFFSFVFLLLFSSIISGQVADSTLNFDLDEITVKSGVVLKPKSITYISPKEIQKADASTFFELGKFIPSVKMQTNSRGESLFYLRGSGERQLSLLFDGIPMNIPWDNRIDLNLIPTNAIGSISVTKGIPSSIYGANSLAGVISVNSIEYRTSGAKRKFSLQFGQNNFQNYSGYWLDGDSTISYLASVSYKNSDGYELPKSYNNPIANPSSQRINSFSKTLNAFAKVKYHFNYDSDITVSVSYINSEKGVPPETDVAKPRFWQYPDWQKLSLGVTGSHKIGKSKNQIFTFALGATKFNMQIDQYKDISYSDIEDIEKDDDKIFFARLIYTNFLTQKSLLKLSFNGLSTIHDEQFLSENYITNTYSQNIYSFGAEYEYINKSYSAILGLSFDGSATPETGDKPSKDGTTDLGINAGFVYSINRDFSVQFNLGRKTRFPTLREMFSGALGRFVPNPELKAEVSYAAESSFSYYLNNAKVDLNLFVSFLDDGIVRESLPGRQFKRINKDQIRNVGIEFNTDYEVNKSFSTNFHFTYLNSFAKNSNGEFKDTLEYKPSMVAGLNLDYSFSTRSNVVLEINYTGSEFGYQEGSEFIKKLPDYLLMNLRFSQTIKLMNNSQTTLFVRINNLFDKLYYTQWSLPEAGRMFWLGANLDI